ncbi:MAG: hypothetical protein IJ001_07610 [Oscillospiraceae bacterium]|nr:hypothetical protein [Oscillospiraceae bacterium]
MNTSEIRRKLWNSLDLYCVRRELVLVCVVVPLVLLPSGCAAGGFREPSFWAMAATVAALTILPFAIYGLWVTIRIYRCSESYIFCKAKLTQPHGSWLRGAMYFTVVLEHPEGGNIIVNTRPIFQSYGWVGLLLEDYLNKTATIAYNEETEAVVVIG